MDFNVSAQNDVERELRVSSLSPLNRLCSIVHDASFVDSIVSLLPRLPLGGNLRAGRWYVKPEILSFDCCFKSADGHYGQWNFSFWRVNLKLLKLLFSRGGAIVVDATRQGKRFPDSLSKTVPIWCFVINEILAELGLLNLAHASDSLVLPEWVPKEEKHWILERSQGWITMIHEQKEFRSVLLELANDCPLRKPLKPVWIHRDQPSIEDSSLVDCISFIPVFCVSVSSPKDNYRWLTHSLKTGETFGFRYIQGAGDDEESWSCGLFPELFWKHKEDLLSRDPMLLKEHITSLLESVKSRSLVSIINPNLLVPHLELFQVDERDSAGVDLFWNGWFSSELPIQPYSVDVHIVLSVGDRNSTLVDSFPLVKSMLDDTCSIICIKLVDRAGRLESKRFGLERTLKEVTHHLDRFLLKKKQSVMIWSPFHTDWATCCVLTWLATRTITRHPQKIIKEAAMHKQIWSVVSEQQKIEDKMELITIFWWLSLSFDVHAPSRSAVQQMHRFLFKTPFEKTSHRIAQS
ncbi:Uncharacterized protein Gasu2_44120 [Galdieria sulphuraria]|uniref:Initiator tRNA phosphoribosyl transferase family protein n=1 Tax=Galdieria sulphuraria TaxID=130081 RepID=M2W6V5_GALSU|nr:initiator tRNA phosphoribosyl transferase family protein [Galdieria sulphuraria]EME31541.1 initiator tRNA phosphoribosyl transferase family protein [Galdieria sulphuraria]GJD10204.1 Uncharacterized protein Gasu2_44120 [Galdieria sulphuraria]|eukprot:XP_005708061.1 initiator tRNA phosphoribosyl transferase family protein [Galdieria sulphuraria]